MGTTSSRRMGRAKRNPSRPSGLREDGFRFALPILQILDDVRQPEMKRTIDPIKSEVIARFLLATAEEMGATLMRTARSGAKSRPEPKPKSTTAALLRYETPASAG